MSTAKTPPARQGPGAHLPQFESENPAVAWARENRKSLITILAALTLGLSLNYYLPRHRVSSLAGSWSLYDEIVADPANFEPERVEQTLARARTDSRVYPWILHQMVATALQRQDRTVLQRLRGELEAVALDQDYAGLRIVGDDGPAPFFQHSLGLVDEVLRPGEVPEFTNPAPTGEKVRFTLAGPAEESFVFEAGLYPDAAPEACAWFLAKVRSGAFADLAGQPFGVTGIKFAGLAAEGEEPRLAVERKWGFFHKLGCLGLIQATDGSGKMDPDAFQITVQDAAQLDGRATMFGMLTSGQDQLERLATLISVPEGAPEFRLVSAEIVGD